MNFTLIRAEYDQDTERAYVELRARDDDGGGRNRDRPQTRPPNPKDQTYARSYVTSALAGALLLGLGTTAALAVTGEFNNMCTMGLASGKDIQTDCSINSHFRQDLLLRQQGGHDPVHGRSDGQYGEGTGLLQKQASCLGCHFNNEIEGAFW